MFYIYFIDWAPLRCHEAIYLISLKIHLSFYKMNLITFFFFDHLKQSWWGSNKTDESDLGILNGVPPVELDLCYPIWLALAICGCWALGTWLMWTNLFFSFQIDYFFQRSFRISKTKEEVQRFSIYFLLPHTHCLSHNNIPHQSGTFVIINELLYWQIIITQNP